MNGTGCGWIVIGAAIIVMWLLALAGPPVVVFLATVFTFLVIPVGYSIGLLG